MSEFQFPVPEISKKAGFSCPPVSIFVHFFFNIVSHPIYFSYFIFFTPYFFKLLTFLIPLFVTSSLLLLAILSASPNLVPDEFHRLLSDSQVGFLLDTYRHVLQQFYSTADGKDENFGYFEQLETFKIMLETSIFEGFESKSEVADCNLGSELESSIVVPLRRTSTDNPNVNSFECHGDHQEVNGVKKLESSFQETESILVKPLDAEPNKVEARKEKGSTKGRSYYDCNGGHDDIEMEYASKVKVTVSQSLDANTEKPKDTGDKQSLCGSLGGLGSMRKEKEWRRSLACKLFEERHNVGGVEGMDMLWETHETESNKAQVDNNRNKGKKFVEVEDEDEDDYGDRDGKLCCLHALKFSAGKMNLGMGRPNLMTISKAFKGIGRLHRVIKNRKKGYH